MRCTYRTALVASGLLAMVAGFDPASAAPTTGACSPTKVKFLASDVTFFTTDSTTFVNVAQGAVKFVQGGTGPSCVIVRAASRRR